jgi:hypothetical protein
MTRDVYIHYVEELGEEAVGLLDKKFGRSA